ncbi:unnamed protein product [Peniophora sp. CBMAI 1063]|nr:unnamed protein product [Peniophora sp. CBMAI 1063]
MAGTSVLIAGLGNAPYPLTKHSLGQYLVDGLAQRLGAGRLRPHPTLRKDGGHLATAKHEGTSLLLYKTGASKLLSCILHPLSAHMRLFYTLIRPCTPQTCMHAFADRLMNISGPPIAAASRTQNAKHLVLIYDSVADAPCTLALKYGGGARGHNGVRSTQAHWPHGSFWHLRAGIGRPSDGTGLAEFVLSKLDAEERAFWGHQGKGMDLVLKALEAALGDLDGQGKDIGVQRLFR